VMAAGNTAKPHGLNLRGLKRRGFSDEVISALKQAYRVVYRSGLGVAEALAQLKDLAAGNTEVARFVEFIRRSERGIIR